MARDTSLDEFLGGESTVTDERDGEAGGTDEDATRNGPDADAVEPAVITYDVIPDGAECAACRDVVTRRWRDEAGMVCGDCKDW